MSYILGLGGPYYHDTSACLVSDTGSIIAFAEEERFTRIKHNRHSRSCSQSTAFCLAKAGLRLEDVGEIAIGWNPSWPERSDSTTDKILIRELLDPCYFQGHTPHKLTIIEHPLAHAASAFYTSGFEESAVLVVDGSGDGAATSIYNGTSSGLELLLQYPFSQSLGWFYETVAEHLGLGDGIISSGKLMGLAAYGCPTYDFDFLRVNQDGSYILDLSRYGLHTKNVKNTDYINLNYYYRLKRAYSLAFTKMGIPPYHRNITFNNTSGRMIANAGFNQNHANFAASAQNILEECLLQLASTALSKTGNSRLCVAGGVGLNCSANGALYRLSGAKQLFVQPVAADAGCAIGAALECALRAGNFFIPSKPFVSTALGPTFTDVDIQHTLDSFKVDYSFHDDNIASIVAKKIQSGSIIGWFQGPCEGGPRALGHRSILADPRNTANRDRINCDIKHREMWRPLAPSILASAMEDYVVSHGPSEFMIVKYKATELACSKIPATVHIDGSLRPQSVYENENPRYFKLLQAFNNETGVPVLLNTSFNRNNEPNVCTPTDAIRTFYSTPLDALAIGSFLIIK